MSNKKVKVNGKLRRMNIRIRKLRRKRKLENERKLEKESLIEKEVE